MKTKNNDMEKIISIPIPKGYEFDFVGTREVYFKLKELPDTVEGCSELMGNKTSMNVMVPNSDDTAVKALCNLLICRRVWWERLNWLPNWSATDQLKYYISRINDNVVTGESLDCEKILSFPDAEVRDDFLKSFHELIVEARYLL